MRLRRGFAVCLFLCLALLPARANAAAILNLETLTPGVLGFSGTFGFDNDVALIYFDVATPALFSVDLTSHVGDQPGFDPYLTLFTAGTDFLGAWDFRADADPLFATLPPTLDPGSYLLALTQYNNYYVPGGGFDYDGPEGTFFIRTMFDPEGVCPGFVAENGSCRTSAFAGTLSVQDAAPASVPEPGTLVLVALGGAGLIAKRRRRSPDTPS